MDIETTINDILVRECGLHPGSTILVGVSGGPDSLCLLHLLYRQGYPILAAHLDHALRDGSAEEAAYVGKLVAVMGINYITERVDVRTYAQREKLSLEEAARVLRYRFLFKKAQENKAAAVAVAHTADDQVETVFMHLLRGTGLVGLKGMAFRGKALEWNSDIPLVRPLLNTWHIETVAYCQSVALQPVIDASNLDPTYFRNRVRLELIPLLESYNPQIKKAIFRMAESLSGDLEIVDSAVKQVYARCCLHEGAGFIIFSYPEVQHLPAGLMRRLFRNVVARLGAELREVGFKDIERMREFILTPTRTRQINLSQGLRMSLDGDDLIFTQNTSNPVGLDYPQLHSNETLNLAVPGKIQPGSYWFLESELITKPVHIDQFWERDDQPFHAWMDGDCLELPLQVRSRRPGDRFYPFGLGGKSLKLSDFMINTHLPRQYRENLPLVCSGGKIAWVPGFRIAEFCRVSPKTRLVLHLHLRQEG